MYDGTIALYNVRNAGSSSVLDSRLVHAVVHMCRLLDGCWFSFFSSVQLIHLFEHTQCSMGLGLKRH